MFAFLTLLPLSRPIRPVRPLPPTFLTHPKPHSFHSVACSIIRPPKSPSPSNFHCHHDNVLIDDATSSYYLHCLLHPTCAQINQETDVEGDHVDHHPLASVEEVGSMRMAQKPPGKRTGRGKAGGRQRGESRPVDLDSGFCSAPNGLSEGPADYLQELLPLLGRQGMERELSEDEAELKEHLRNADDLLSSMHRSSGRLDNLRPYALQQERETKCLKCNGVGMCVCAYCKGEGFVDLGENGEKFESVFEDNILTMPKNVMGTVYHCPLCGGLREERCIECFGTGLLEEAEKGPFEADVAHDHVNTDVFNLQDLLEAEKDRIEIGKDGTIIMRAKKVKRLGRPPKKSKEKKEGKDPEVPVQGVKKRRGRPPKVKLPVSELPVVPLTELDLSMSPPIPEIGTTVVVRVEKKANTAGTSTDFVNTTDYKVGRKLRKRNKKLEAEKKFIKEFKERTASQMDNDDKEEFFRMFDERAALEADEDAAE